MEHEHGHSQGRDDTASLVPPAHQEGAQDGHPPTRRRRPRGREPGGSRRPLAILLAALLALLLGGLLVVTASAAVIGNTSPLTVRSPLGNALAVGSLTPTLGTTGTASDTGGPTH